MNAPAPGRVRAAVLRLAAAGEGNAVVAVLSWTASLILAWVVIGVLVHPTRPFLAMGRGWPWLVALVLLLLLWWMARRVHRPGAWLERHVAVRRVLAAVLLAGAAVLMWRLGLAVRFPPGWDAGLVEQWAYGLAHGTAGPDDHEAMANLYPNNLFLVAVLTRWFELCALLGVTSMGTGSVLLNVIALTVALALTWSIARRVAGPLAGYLAVLMGVPLVVASPWIGVAYSDTLGMVFPAGVLALYLVARDASRRSVWILCWIGIGLLTLVGYKLKPTVVFVLIAVVVVVMAEVVRRLRARSGGWVPSLQRAGLATAAVVLGVLAGNAAVGATLDPLGIAPEGEEKELAMPLTHFMMMGTQHRPPAGTDLGSWGGWSGPDVELSKSVPPQERFSHSLEVYFDRVQEWGAWGYPRFLDEKARWIVGDGNFNAYRHGQMFDVDPPWEFHDQLSRELRPWMTPHHEEYRWTTLARQGVWFAILVLVVAPAFWWRRGLHRAELAVMRVALLGLLTFLLFFEGGSRYLYLYLPLFLVLAACTATQVAAVRPRETTDAATAPQD